MAHFLTLAMSINDRFNQIIKHLYSNNKSAFANAIGVSPSVVENIVGKRHGKPSFDVLEKICAIEQIDTKWLLTGKGEMLQSQVPTTSVLPPRLIKDLHTDDTGIESYQNYPERIPGSIPLVSEKAVGGIINEYFNVRENDILGYYVIPKFRNLGVDFMIEISGDSMVPRFYPGDIIACSILHNPKFIQWNKSHLLATEEQGLIVKRLMPGDTSDCLQAVSENKEYPPFFIPKEEIKAIALVVGSIHVE